MTEKIDWQNNPFLLTGSATYTFAVPPKPSGCWVLYDNAPYKTKFYVYHRPTDEQIKNTEQLLGWKWEEA